MLRIMAVMPVFNEEDILKHAIMKLLEQDIEVVVLDNHSTDGSRAIAEKLNIEVETFGEPDSFREPEALHAVMQKLHKHKPGWCMFHAADEIYRSNRGDETYRAAVEKVHADGYSIIDHLTELYPPVDNNFKPGTDHEQYFTMWKKMIGQNEQQRCWRYHEEMKFEKLGHRVSIPAGKIYPEKMLRKHYPIRSAKHGERKVFSERWGRGLGFSFSQYKIYKKGRNRHGFVYDKDELK